MDNFTTYLSALTLAESATNPVKLRNPKSIKESTLVFSMAAKRRSEVDLDLLNDLAVHMLEYRVIQSIEGVSCGDGDEVRFTACRGQYDELKRFFVRRAYHRRIQLRILGSPNLSELDRSKLNTDLAKL